MSKNPFDLENRTAKLGEQAIGLLQKLPHDTASLVLGKQFIRSATSIGANYMEANGASSRRDFRNKISICKKEAQETKHWLRMLRTSAPVCIEDINPLWQETQELTMIFQKIMTSLDKK